VSVDVLSGPHRGQSFEFGRHESLVGGRAETCQLRLDGDPHVSRFHFRLEVNPPAARIIDLDSSNGIRVNGRAAKWSELSDGDEVAIGATLLRIRVITRNRAQAEDATVDWPGAGSSAESLRTVAARETTGDRPQPAFVHPDYELQDELGRGPVGSVHRAVEKASGRIVALKVIPLRRALDRTARETVAETSASLSRLRHQLIVQQRLDLPVHNREANEFSLGADPEVVSRFESSRFEPCSVSTSSEHGSRTFRAAVTTKRALEVNDNQRASREVVDGDARSRCLWERMSRKLG